MAKECGEGLQRLVPSLELTFAQGSSSLITLVHEIVIRYIHAHCIGRHKLFCFSEVVIFFLWLLWFATLFSTQDSISPPPPIQIFLHHCCRCMYVYEVTCTVCWPLLCVLILAVILWAAVGCSVHWVMPLTAVRRRALWTCSRQWRPCGYRSLALWWTLDSTAPSSNWCSSF